MNQWQFNHNYAPMHWQLCCIKDNVFAIMHWWKYGSKTLYQHWQHWVAYDDIQWKLCIVIANANMLLWQCAINFALMQMNWQSCIDANAMTIIH